LIQNAEAEIKERQKKQRDKEAMEEVKEIAASHGMTPKELILMKVLGALACALAWVGLFLRYGRRPPERISQYLSSFGKAQAATGESVCTRMLLPAMPCERWNEATRVPLQ